MTQVVVMDQGEFIVSGGMSPRVFNQLWAYYHFEISKPCWMK
jgi:hypothetical protein